MEFYFIDKLRIIVFHILAVSPFKYFYKNFIIVAAKALFIIVASEEAKIYVLDTFIRKTFSVLSNG